MIAAVERLWSAEGSAYRLARAALTPLSWLFAVAAAARVLLYRTGLLRVHGVAVAVVSIGNIRVGGSGKTPLVIWLVERLRSHGLRPVVVARGYGAGRSGSTIISAMEAGTTGPATGSPAGSCEGPSAWPSGCRHVRAGVDDTAGLADEAMLVAVRTGCPVVTDVDRVAACELARTAFTPDLVIVDDGFQHLRLRRDLDVVIVGEEDFRSRLLPAGPLREPPAALGRADVVVADGGGASLPRLVRRALGLVALDARLAQQGRLEPLERLQGLRVAAVAGIARPRRFFAMLEHAGAVLSATIRFPDHHHYSRADWRRIVEVAGDAERIVTTEKDLVKLAPLAAGDGRLLALRLGVDVDGGDALVDRILRVVRSRRTKRPGRVADPT